MFVDASKTSALISGAVVAVTSIVFENNNFPPILVVLVFFAAVFFYVIGLEIWRELVKGDHIGFPIGPKDKEGWAIYGRVWLRMLVCFIGVAITMLVVSVWAAI